MVVQIKISKHIGYVREVVFRNLKTFESRGIIVINK